MITAWSDSAVTLSWIKSPYVLKTKVANRVSHIQGTVSPDLWRHIPSDYNPVACASIELYPSELYCEPVVVSRYQNLQC